MEFLGFREADFDVFEVPGLEPRMEALKEQLRPKLQQLGQDFSSLLEEWLGMPVYSHVAKHARRTVNPPKDSWVAFCTDKRGYKKHPHFQIGAWQTHAFATFGLIYESPVRGAYAQQVREHADEIVRQIPRDYVWIPNHMDPASISAADVNADQLLQLADRLASGRQGELLVGITVPRVEAVGMTAMEFEQRVIDCFRTVIPLYHLATKEVIHA